MKIVGLGDSLTYGYGVPPGQGWFDRMQEYFPGIIWDNCGIPGDTSSGMLRRFAREAINKQPEYVTILGGVNDLLNGKPPEAVLNNLVRIGELAEKQKIKPWLLLPLTVSFNPGAWGWLSLTEAKEINRQIGVLRELIRGQAEEKTWFCFDLMSGLPEFASLEKHFLEDGVHVDARIHKLIAQNFKTYVEGYF